MAAFAMKLLLLLAVSFLPPVFAEKHWPYLQIYPPVNASDSRTPIYFALMLSSTFYKSILAVPGVQIALDYINSEPTILPGYTLHYTLTDSQCNEQIARESTLHQLEDVTRVKLGWLGSGCSTATSATAPWTQLYNLTQISCVSSSPVLKQKEVFRYYFQMQPSLSVFGKGLIGIINEYGWKQVGLITLLDPVVSELTKRVKNDLEQIEVQYSETLMSEDLIVFRPGAETERDPFDPKMRIFILILGPTQATWLACEAHKRGLKYPKYQFLILGGSGGVWLADPNSDLGCTLEERVAAYQFALTVSVPDTATVGQSTQPSVGTLDATDFWKEHFRKSNSTFNRHLNLFSEYFPVFSVACYEAALALALALQKTLEDLESSESLNMEAGWEAGLSEGERFTLANFSYSNSVIVQRMFHHLSSTDFIGITGKIAFDDEGIRALDEVTVMQYLSNNGIFHEEVVGTVALSTAEADSEMRILDNLDQQLYWTSGIPYDGVPISEIVTVSVPVTVIFTIAGVSGIGFAAFFGAFNFIYRKKRIIRLSSPKLNYLIVWGAIHFYLSAIGLVIPTTDPDTVVALCFINLTIIYTGYSLCYGTILVKMFRVWYIFKHHTMKKKINITDFHLGCAVMSLVGIDLLMIVMFILVQGIRDNFAVNLSPSAENPTTYIGPTAIIQQNFVYACDSDGRIVLVILLYCSKILLQIFSLVLAFQTRNIKVKGLDDSKYIPSAVYISTIVLPLSLTAAFSLRTHVNAFPAVLSIAHFFGASSILIIVFVPRIIGLYKDPTGINVFDNRYSSPNYDDNDIVALRRDVQQLRVTLHFAQKRCKCSSATTSDAVVVPSQKGSATGSGSASHINNNTTTQNDN